MSQSNLIELTCFDPKANVRLTTYADTIITEPGCKGESIAAVRFGGYPEMVRAMSDAIYGGDRLTKGNYGLLCPLFCFPGRRGAAKGADFAPPLLPFLPNLLRPHLLRPEIRSHYTIPSGPCIVGVFPSDFNRMLCLAVMSFFMGGWHSSLYSKAFSKTSS